MRHERGFTLIEILVAISVLAISLVVILQLFSGGLKAVRLSNDYTRAVFYAREKMDELLLSGDLAPGTLQGESDDSLRWTAEIELVEPETDEGPDLPCDLLKITLRVMWAEGEKKKRFQLSTLKVVEKGEDEISEG